MGRFYYKAKDITGNKSEGYIEATDSAMAFSIVRQRGLYPLNIASVDKIGSKEVFVISGSGDKEISVFCRQFAALLKSGISISKCLGILATQSEKKDLKQAILAVNEDVHSGRSLYDSMSRRKTIFPMELLKMVEAGELSGTLEDSLERMSLYFERRYSMRRKVSTMMIYPILLLCLALAVFIFIVVGVIPSYSAMFENNNVELPGITKALVSLSGFILLNWPIIVGVVLVLIGGFYLYFIKGKGRLEWDRFKLNIPLFKKFNRQNEGSQFARKVSTLLKSGIHLSGALAFTKTAAENRYIKSLLVKLESRVNQGWTLGMALEEMNVFPPMLVNMVQLGEESGNLEDMLEKTADIYDEEAEDSAKRLLAIMEPALIIVIGVLILFAVLSLAMPMADLAGGIS